MDDVTAFKTLEPVVDHAIRLIGSGIEIFGVLVGRPAQRAFPSLTPFTDIKSVL
jgi:hypothetical protein